MEQDKKATEQGVKKYEYTEQERERIKYHISDLFLKGSTVENMLLWFQTNTGFPITKAQIRYFLALLFSEWNKEYRKNIEERVSAELAKLGKIEYEAWQAWEKSKEGIRKITSKQMGGVIEEAILYGGNPKFLEIAKACIAEKVKWLSQGSGALPPQHTDSIMARSVYIGVVDRKDVEAVVKEKEKSN